MGIPVISSTSPKPATRPYTTHTPRAARCETSSPVASVECEGTDEQVPVVVMLFADNTVRAYDTKSLDLVGPILDLGTKEPHTVICSVDDSFVVTGGAEGSLILSNVRTGCVADSRHMHTGAVVSVDSWLNYVVSVGRDNRLNIFRFVDGDFFRVAFTRELRFAPLAVKFALRDGILKVIVAHDTSSHIHIYSVDGRKFIHSLYLTLERDSLDECKVLDIAVNKTRTILAAAFENTSGLEILIKDLSIFNSADRIISTSCHGILIARVNWSATDSAVWITDGDGTVNRVDVRGLREDAVLSDSKNAVGCLQVCLVGDREVIITGGRNGEVTLWK